MRKTVILYGIALAALTGLLKFIECKFFVTDLFMKLDVRRRTEAIRRARELPLLL